MRAHSWPRRIILVPMSNGRVRWRIRRPFKRTPERSPGHAFPPTNRELGLSRDYRGRAASFFVPITIS